MQFSRETSDAKLIVAWESGRMRIGNEWLSGHLIVAPDRVADWPVSEPDRLELSHLDPAISLEPQIIVLGMGTEILLPDVTLIASLAELGIGLEIMSTPAACRTYNVLVHEGRNVVAALFNPAS